MNAVQILIPVDSGTLLLSEGQGWAALTVYTLDDALACRNKLAECLHSPAG